MDFMDTLNEWAKKLTDKTNEVVEIAKLRAANFSKNEKANELKKEIGEICFSNTVPGMNWIRKLRICVRKSKN